MNTLNETIANHPGLTALVLLGFQLILAWLWATLKWFVVREFNSMEIHEARQDESIEHIEGRLNKYDVNSAVSTRRFDEMYSMIKKHVDKEDEQAGKIEDIRVKVAKIEGHMARNGR